ncbi:DUF3349 domain-containing protein [Rhodococcus sp. RS1C4]|uniref:DUF3349 domain-containing protein n=1 Tax=Nocardiaceae TaxID=85025 RepID=UPI0003734CBE|nr:MULTISPECIES: DUF3349 domain-containing protein [Rhodococcus]OZC51261.1 DUF3349 domain-containing protein [Rhodococcus sp. RS1C4]OZC91211.1 DUF3349 domain-containing protein [Rhodococcus sp. 06-418-1B]OZD10737.1 DUF3349 domain-containing protein [Rhodococcus sp. 06-156-4C]OZD23198.1 DUF3349 domain-containing protein [Rhodococcus sp. 06-156-3C]OZD28019.1 DUF3349 domain-containing protein [Rhodococcus sp. 06-156-4a]
MAVPSFLQSILEWLRAGYPEGVPDADYVPLLALLTRRLTEDEIQAVVDALIAGGQLPADKAGIAVVITKVTNEMPREEDISRVRSKLAAGGWPLADPFTI